MIRLSRFYHTTSKVSSSLAKLRKTTGFSISHCKKALVQFPDNLEKAEEWLQNESKKMGWSKWDKIQSRSAAQGLIGVYAGDSLGVMVEVNCETDFVAKNVEFRSLVGNVLLLCLEKSHQFKVAEDEKFRKCLFTEADLMNIEYKSFTIQELLNSAISKFNEKTVFKRAVVLKTNPSLCIAGLSHPSEHHCPNFQQCQTGKFGALIVYKSGEEEEEEFGRNMCQHIIGMNPSSIGEYEEGLELGIKKSEPVEEKHESIEEKSESMEEKNELLEEKNELIVEESRLLFQPYLMDPTLNVYNYTKRQADILDFERFECGAT